MDAGNLDLDLSDGRRRGCDGWVRECDATLLKLVWRGWVDANGCRITGLTQWREQQVRKSGGEKGGTSNRRRAIDKDTLVNEQKEHTKNRDRRRELAGSKKNN